MLNPQWLASFAALAELGGFTRAANRLGLTQAAVSQHVQHLENALGPLLIRRPRSIELTPAGEALLDYCNQVEQADRRLQSRLSDTDAFRGDISLSTPPSVGLALYPLLLALQQEYPELLVRHRVASDHESLDAVLHKRVEFGLVTLRPDDPRIAAQAFAYEALELVAPAGEQVERWEDLEHLGFVDHPDGQAMAGRLLERRFPGAPGVRSLPCRGFTNQVGLLLEPVARGLGFTVIPRHARLAYARQEAIQVIDCGPGAVDILWLIHRAEWPLSARAAFVADYLKRRMPVPA